MILKNVELRWVRMGPTNVDMGFDKDTPNWTVSAYTRDKAQSTEWKDAGLNVKVDEDGEGVVYSTRVKQDKFRKDGQENKMLPVVGPDLMPLSDDDRDAIGNGTTANVKVWTGEYNYNGRKGIMSRLQAVQVVNFKRYEGAGGELSGFEAVGGSPFVDETDSEDDVY